MKGKLIANFIGALALTVSSVASPVLAQQHTTSEWDCFLNNQDNRSVGHVRIWWGHTSGDAAWACNNWVSTCGNNGGCYAFQTRQ